MCIISNTLAEDVMQCLHGTAQLLTQLTSSPVTELAWYVFKQLVTVHHCLRLSHHLQAMFHEQVLTTGPAHAHT